MTRKIIKTICIIALICATTYGACRIYEWSQPEQYRSNTSWPNLKRLYQAYQTKHASFTTKGFDKYNVIGTARLDLGHFKKTVKNWEGKGKVHILNGRPNNYYYYHDKEMKAYCLDVENGQIRDSHKKRVVDKMMCRYNRWVEGVNTMPPLSELKTEKQALKALGFDLIQPFPETWLEDWSFVEGLINFFESTPKNDMIYFHCDHGRGRTTTFMTLLDIFHNADDLTLKEIIARQFILGGVDFLDLKPWANSTWKVEYLRARLNIINTFYSYMKATDGYKAKTPWTQWLKMHPVDPTSVPPRIE